MKVLIKKLSPEAVIPSYAKIGDAGMDLTAISKKYITISGVESEGEFDTLEELKDTIQYVEYDTGLSFEIPEGYVGLVFPRSSISNKDLHMCNSVGVVDSNYRGPVKIRMTWTNLTDEQAPSNPLLYPIVDTKEYEVGDRVAQLIIMPVPFIEFEEGDLSETTRGEGGFGSTGI